MTDRPPAATAPTAAGRSAALWPALTALVLVALNLRPAISSVGPVALDIQAELGWSHVQAGAVTTLTVLAMGLTAPTVPRLARRVGRDHAITGALLALAATLALRLLAAWPWVLPVTAVLAGAAIAVTAGLVPGVVRERMAARVGRATGVWTAAMLCGAALGGGLTVALQHALGSWPRALAAWAVPAALAGLVWATWSRGSRAPAAATPGGPSAAHPPMPWRHPVAWALTAYLGLNSFVFYSLLAWLPASYEERGWTEGEAGLLLGVFTLTQVPAALLLTPLSDRLPDRRPTYALMCVLTAAPLAVVALAPGLATVLVLLVLGVGIGAGFALGLVLLAEYAPDAAAAARLTGVAFTAAYVVGALGPLAVGAVAEAAGSWPPVLLGLAAVMLLQLLVIPALRRGVVIG